MDNSICNNDFNKEDIFVIKYFSIISIITALIYVLFYIFYLKNIYLILLNIFFVFLYLILWYIGIKFRKWYFAYIITFVNMFHVFIYTFFLFGFDINFHYYFLMYPMAMLIIRESKIDKIKVITIIISILLFVLREILGNKLNYKFSFSYIAGRIINVFSITSLILGLSFIIYSYIAKINNIKKELYLLSITDQMTGLYNRRYLFDQFCKYNKDSADKICIMIIDIDDFKEINDIYGHYIGDEVIKSVSNIMINTVDNYGIVGRIGGEEFCVILTNSSKEIYSNLSEKIRKNIEKAKLQLTDGKSISRTVSIGVACQREYNYSFNKLFVSADKAMYSAKDLGKNRVVQFSV